MVFALISILAIAKIGGVPIYCTVLLLHSQTFFVWEGINWVEIQKKIRV